MLLWQRESLYFAAHHRQQMQHGLQGQQRTVMWCWITDGTIRKECGLFELVEYSIVFFEYVCKCWDSVFHRLKRDKLLRRYYYPVINLSLEWLYLHGLLQRDT